MIFFLETYLNKKKKHKLKQILRNKTKQNKTKQNGSIFIEKMY